MDSKRHLKLAIRIGLSVGFMVVLYFVTPSFDTDELLPEWSASTPIWLGAALILTVTGFWFAAVRWHRVLFAFDMDSRTTRLFGHYMAGQFISNFVPTTVGGDVLRVNRLRRDTENAPGSFASVLVERLSGWIVLPVLSLIGLLANPGLRNLGHATSVAFILALVVLAAFAVLLLLVSSDWLGRFFEKRDGWARYASALHLGIDKLREHPQAALKVLISAFTYQLVVLAAAACAARAMGIEGAVGPTAILAFLPAVLILQMVPLGIGGIGPREAALALFFGQLGVPEERAFALGILLYFLTVTASLPGLIPLLFNRADDEMTDSGPNPDVSAES